MLMYRGDPVPPELRRAWLEVLREAPLFLRVGTVVRVDYESMTLDVRFEDQPGGRVSIPISVAGGSQRALMVTVPEENSIVVVGFSRYHKGFRRPFIVATLPVAWRSKLHFKPYKAQPEGDPVKRRYRGRKLYPGDAYISSSKGSEIHLNENILIEGGSFDTFLLRGDDGLLVTRSLGRHHTDSAVRSWSGAAIRDDFEIIPHPVEDKEEGIEGKKGEIVSSGYPYVRLSSGRKLVHVTKTGKTIDEGDKAFTEARSWVEEFSDEVRKIPQELHGFDISIIDPQWRENAHQLIETASGTLIGDDPIYEKSRYGRVLVPKLLAKNYYFEGDDKDTDKPNIYENSYVEGSGWKSSSKDYLDEEALPVKGETQKKVAIAAAYRLRMRNQKSWMTYLALTKEGKALVHLGRSSDLDALGEGRSLEFASEGGVKAVVGRNKDQKHSVFYALRGSVVGHIGSTDPSINKRKRQKDLYKDESYYGEHGYHDLKKIAKKAPIPELSAITNPEYEGLSVDLIVDKNAHIIVGSDETCGSAKGDRKSVTLDTHGSVVMALGKDTKDHSVVLEADGSFEGQIGKNQKDLRSINLACLGGVQIHIDDGDKHKGQALHVELNKGAEIRINDTDDEGYAFRLDIRGSVKARIHGDKVELSVSAVESVHESVVAPKITKVMQGEVTEFIIGNYKQVVVGDREQFTTGKKVYS